MMGIVNNKKIQGGIPCIRGTRIPVSSILLYLSQGWTANKIINDYRKAGVPLQRADIEAALDYAGVNLDKALC
mgnify:CR=1 FL=1